MTAAHVPRPRPLPLPGKPLPCPNLPAAGRRTLACGAALLALAVAGTPAVAQTFVPDASGRQGAALAPTATTGYPGMLADGTSLLRLPVVIAPAVPSSRDDAADADADSPATLLADRIELSGDRVLTASGGVVVWHRGARLIAERVIYDGAAGTMRIEGPIHLSEPGKTGSDDEAVLIADAAQLDEGLRDGLLSGARLVLARELQMAAAEVRRSGKGRMTTLTHVVASSCHVCAENPTPLWEIRARRIIHDADTRRLHFERAQFRAFGLPLVTLPRFAAPDPTVDRMTGFLTPVLRTTSRLGVGFKLPYFITLGDSADVTLTPYLSASRTTTLELRYRQAFTNGALQLEGAISRDDLEDGTRGYLFGAARFRLPRDYWLGLQLQSVSDRPYLLDYDVTDADRLWSGVTVDRVASDRLVAARIGRYQTFREGEDDATSPSLVADALWERRFRPAGLGGEAGLQFSIHAHRRSSNTDGDDGRDMMRGSARLDWQRVEILPGGVVGSVQTRIDADLYRIGDDSRFDSSQTRVTPIAAVEFRWPLIAQNAGVTHTLEPVAQFVWSPDSSNDNAVPNEDSMLVEFDEGNLFSIDRLPGRDVVEGGFRANIGLGWTRIDPAGWSLGLTAGRVLRSRDDPAFDQDGQMLSGRRSDWLLAATYSGSNGLAMVNRALFDDDLSLQRNELRIGWLRKGLQLSAGYLWIDAATEPGRIDDVSELTASTAVQLAPGWRLNAETRYDFAADRAQKAELGLEYRNECVTVDLSVSRRFTSSDTVRADTDVGLSVRLGGFGRQQNNGAGTVARRSCVR
ncbi:LPS-assembly protein LptD [Paracoccus alkenifer]|uniref:LPS-assembly protein LptD n=1 Tax=Paracoccus alkenifer TaxID=65735 RepID=A0A1H6KB40_9RHOB|nr:LPS assembly protein LptD [Paracoccus alkenifer]SEH70355.1 LPS-assembly protein [Paracoccus alkenifer]